MSDDDSVPVMEESQVASAPKWSSDETDENVFNIVTKDKIDNGNNKTSNAHNHENKSDSKNVTNENDGKAEIINVTNENDGRAEIITDINQENYTSMKKQSFKKRKGQQNSTENVNHIDTKRSKVQEVERDLIQDTKNVFNDDNKLCDHNVVSSEISTSIENCESEVKDKNKSECDNTILPKCMLCSNVYDIDNYSDRSPVMSMSCYHTICKLCVISSIKKRRIVLKRNNINSTPCPIATCKSPNAYRNEIFNWNEQLIIFCKKSNN